MNLGLVGGPRWRNGDDVSRGAGGESDKAGQTEPHKRKNRQLVVL